MVVWRIYDHHASYAQLRGFDPLSGAGGLTKPARWHHKGHPIIYTSMNPGAALLEVLVYETSESFRERTLLQIELDDDIETVTPQRLVRLLADAPPGKPEMLTRDFGSRWLEDQRSLALRVPSIVMPYEHNIIINPAHPRAANVRVAHADIITLDQRLIVTMGAGGAN